MLAFNRTTVELKLCLSGCIAAPGYAFNRTTVELKRGTSGTAATGKPRLLIEPLWN